MIDQMLSLLDSRRHGLQDVPVELSITEVDQIAGGLNPQPLPPGKPIEEVSLSDHWNR